MMLNKPEFKRGDILKCRQGHYGLVLDIKPVADGYCYKGIHLGTPWNHASDPCIGSPWGSVCPTQVGNIHDMICEKPRSK